ncbi:MAG TPA: SDR family NAD(P)-dependent oxidoreductase [Pirellulaceae bacterium]|nr:SDR family NAD(P)-dependent oxidoreductase [Pirellulaceae bacterium]HMO94008.1 SDR family NAD(P)-dependent oxidoreductase [Pirellulaceae bacterium]HMP70881.1 SDR family NAD(P)-dependent oxidoreductase [Pirellulaceae bacterium]
MRTVIITGATRGLGLTLADHLLREGYRVVGVGRKISEGFEKLVSTYPETGLFEPFDLSELAKIHGFSTEIVRRHGRPWGLINNAALGSDGVLATQHESEIAALIRVNIESPILLTKYILRPMLIARGGRIINISSIIASTGFNGLSVYGATKAALIGFTKSLAREVGKAGITVNTIAPGYMDTDMTAGLEGEKLASIKRRSPLGRLATTADVAHAVSYLLGDGAANVTGTTLTIDAGSTA